MATLTDLRILALTGYNLPFTLALLAFLCLSFGQLVGLDQEPEADLDLDLDVDTDLEPDWTVHDLVGITQLPQFLGMGRIPTTMILLLLLLGFGVTGWLGNSLLLTAFASYPEWGILAVLAVALITTTWFTAGMTRLLGHAVPAFTSTATSVQTLVCRQGWVSSQHVDENYGLVKVRDAAGTVHTVVALIDPGHLSTAHNTKVLLVEYDSRRKLFIVEPVDMEVNPSCYLAEKRT